jgi:nuclear pore complex protein Nup54
LNPTQSGGGLFGASTQGAGGTNPLLGGSTTQPTGGLFGNFNSNQPTAATNTGGLFGASQQQQQLAPAGNIFGGGAPASNTGLFKPAGGLFGSLNTGAGSAPNPLFGGAQQPQQQNQVQSNAFGQLGQQPQQNQAQSNAFGQLAQQQQQQQQQQRPLFGTSLNQSSTGMLGGNSLAPFSSQNSLFSSRSTILPAQQRDIQMQFAALAQRIEAVVQAWNANSPLCRFQVRYPTCDIDRIVGLTFYQFSITFTIW